MVTVINPRSGNAFTDVLGALNTILGSIQANQQTGQQSDLLKAKLLRTQGTFQPAPAPERSFLDVLFGGSGAADNIRIGQSNYQFQPYPKLTSEDLEGLGLGDIPGLQNLALDPKSTLTLLRAARARKGRLKPPAPATPAAPRPDFTRYPEALRRQLLTLSRNYLTDKLPDADLEATLGTVLPIEQATGLAGQLRGAKTLGVAPGLPTPASGAPAVPAVSSADSEAEVQQLEEEILRIGQILENRTLAPDQAAYLQGQIAQRRERLQDLQQGQ